MGSYKLTRSLQRWTRFSKIYLILSVYMLLASDYLSHINEYEWLKLLRHPLPDEPSFSGLVHRYNPRLTLGHVCLQIHNLQWLVSRNKAIQPHQKTGSPNIKNDPTSVGPGVWHIFFLPEMMLDLYRITFPLLLVPSVTKVRVKNAICVLASAVSRCFYRYYWSIRLKPPKVVFL